MDEFDPFLDAFNTISREDNKKPINPLVINNQNQSNINSEIKQNIINKENNSKSLELNEHEEENKTNNIVKEENNKTQSINNIAVKEESVEQTDNILIGKKTKPDNELDSAQISSVNNNLNNINTNKNETKKEFPSICIPNNNENKIVEIYDYGYTINLLNDGESGLIEDFLNEKQNEATTSDYYNFNLNEEDWIKIVNHGILLHYERHIIELKDEIEKRKKMQSTGNTQMMMPMNQMMFMNMNMNNGVMFIQNMNNLKTMQMPYAFNK